MGKGIDVHSARAVIAVCEERNYSRSPRQASSLAAAVFAEHKVPMSMKTLSETLPLRPQVSLSLSDELMARLRPKSSLAQLKSGCLGLVRASSF